MIKNVVAMIILLSVSLSAMGTASDPKKQETKKKSGKEFCYEIQDVSDSIMQSRLDGVPMANIFKQAEGNKLIEYIIIEAYKETQYSSKEINDQTRVEFTNKMFMQCQLANEE